MDKQVKIGKLRERLVYYEAKLAFKMKRYHGVIHESAASEMKHQEVMVLRAMVDAIKNELRQLDQSSTR